MNASSFETPPCTVVILGATGDLTHRKLLPALYNLACDGLLHPDTSVVGFARRGWNDDEFRKRMREAVEEHSRRTPVRDDIWKQFCGDMTYVSGSFDDADAFRRLGEVLARIDDARSHPGCHLFYLATPPSAYETIVANLGDAGLARDAGAPGASRIIVEKPFGRDLETATKLNRELHLVFDESQVFRIDHYLGKETVQNILVFRLDNGIFEPLWNCHHVDHVQITVAEADGVGLRAGFYEEAGVSRDILQNHLMQLLTLVGMEPPVRFDAKSVRDEKVKVLRAIQPFSADDASRYVVRGQYVTGRSEDGKVPGYLEEEGVSPDSTTETYLAARFLVENWRWGGTPFYLRSGKRLPKRATEIAIVFNAPPYEFFQDKSDSRPRPNVLRLRMQPEEGISLSFESKTPGQTKRIEEVRMDFSYDSSFGEQSPEAYEHLLLDAIQGDSTLFAREDEVRLSWRLVDAIVGAWPQDKGGAPHPYEAGTWGPAEASRMIEADGRQWLNP
jgi:glucose-6-phosphate 1-dehydrogenase